MLFLGALAQAGLVQTLDKKISRQHLRIDSIFPESKLKNDMFFPDRLAIKNMIFQTQHLFHAVVETKQKSLDQ